jgi:hypothetical protein
VAVAAQVNQSVIGSFIRFISFLRRFVSFVYSFVRSFRSCMYFIIFAVYDFLFSLPPLLFSVHCRLRFPAFDFTFLFHCSSSLSPLTLRLLVTFSLPPRLLCRRRPYVSSVRSVSNDHLPLTDFDNDTFSDEAGFRGYMWRGKGRHRIPPTHHSCHLDAEFCTSCHLDAEFCTDTPNRVFSLALRSLHALIEARGHRMSVCVTFASVCVCSRVLSCIFFAQWHSLSLLSLMFFSVSTLSVPGAFSNFYSQLSCPVIIVIPIYLFFSSSSLRLLFLLLFFFFFLLYHSKRDLCSKDRKFKRKHKTPKLLTELVRLRRL